MVTTEEIRQRHITGEFRFEPPALENASTSIENALVAGGSPEGCGTVAGGKASTASVTPGSIAKTRCTPEGVREWFELSVSVALLRAIRGAFAWRKVPGVTRVARYTPATVPQPSGLVFV
jgi:hypothetical protein